MAIHRVTVQLGTTALPENEGNRQRVFVFAGSIAASVGQIGGNIGKRVPASGEHHFDLNHPRVPGAISVSAYSAQKYDSADLSSEPSLVDQLSTAIEKGLILVQDEDATLAGQTGAVATMAAASGGLIRVTGLTGMVDPDSEGRLLVFTGAATPANNGTFIIKAYVSATSVDIAAGAAPGNDANNGALNWSENGVTMDRTALTALI